MTPFRLLSGSHALREHGHIFLVRLFLTSFFYAQFQILLEPFLWKRKPDPLKESAENNVLPQDERCVSGTSLLVVVFVALVGYLESSV